MAKDRFIGSSASGVMLMVAACVFLIFTDRLASSSFWWALLTAGAFVGLYMGGKYVYKNSPQNLPLPYIALTVSVPVVVTVLAYKYAILFFGADAGDLTGFGGAVIFIILIILSMVPVKK